MSEELSGYDSERVIDDAFVPYMIRCARSGCQSSARNLASIAARYIRAGEPLPATLRNFIADALVSGSQDKSVDKALLLKHGPGKKDTTLYQKQAVANEVRRLYWIGEAKTITEACEIVSRNGATVANGSKVTVSPGTAYQYYYEIFPGSPQRCPEV